jgi:hypothetical protein
MFSYKKINKHFKKPENILNKVVAKHDLNSLLILNSQFSSFNSSRTHQ